MRRATALLALALLAATVRADDARILTVLARHVFDGAEVRGETVLAIRGGKLLEVAPVGGEPKTDLVAEWVTPGFVDANTGLGILGPDTEYTREVTPRFRAAAEFDPADPRLRRALAAGVTTAYVSPGTMNVISGRGAVLAADGEGAFRVVRDAAALEVTVTNEPARGNYGPRRRPPVTIYARRPNTRMGVVWEIRRAFFAAREGGADPDSAVVRRALRGEIPIRATARREEDIRTACRIAAEFGIRGLVIEDGTEAHRVLRELADRDARVVLPPPSYSESGWGRDATRVHLGTAKALEAAGVPFAISSGGDGTAIRDAAAMACRFGASRAAALAAVTSRAAEIAGVADRAGRLRPGRRADLLLFDGDPLEPASRIVRVMVSGETVVSAGKKGADR